MTSHSSWIEDMRRHQEESAELYDEWAEQIAESNAVKDSREVEQLALARRSLELNRRALEVAEYALEVSKRSEDIADKSLSVEKTSRWIAFAAVLVAVFTVIVVIVMG